MSIGEKSIAWQPQPGPQDLFVRCPAFECMVGGALGGGKSDALLGDFSRGIELGDAWVGVYFRRHFPDMDDVIRRSHEIFGKVYGSHCYSGSKYQWNFPTGAILQFRALERDDDVYKFQGQQFSWVGFDELTQWASPFQYTYMMTRLRSAKGAPVRMRCGTNPGGPGHPVRQGEVLTPSGWKDIWSMAVGDEIFTVQSDKQITITRVEQVHRNWHVGDLVQASARGLFVECTPDHRVAKVGGIRLGKNTRDKTSDAFSIVPFEDLPGQATILRSGWWRGERLPDFSLARTSRAPKINQPLCLTGVKFCELLGWFLSEGCTVAGDKHRSSVIIAQMKQPQRARLKEFLEDACGFKVRWDKSGGTIYSREWADYFRRFGKCRDKYIPQWVKAGDENDLRALFDALMSGDGHWVRDGLSGEYYTISSRLADDVCEIALKLGYVTHVSSRQRHNRSGLSYCVSFKVTKSGGTELQTGHHSYAVDTKTKRKSDIKRIPYEGPVCCLGVPDTHAMIIRQRGSVWVSGNSWVKARFIDPMPAGIPLEVTTTSGRKYHRVFIPSKLEDNRILMQNDPAYGDRIYEVGDPSLARALREGDWNIVAGAAFQEFDPKIHVVKTRPIPTDRPVWRSMDWGFAEPYGNLWMFPSNEGKLIIGGELYGWSGKPNIGTKEPPSEVRRKVAMYEALHELYVPYGLLDNQCWEERGTTSQIVKELSGGAYDDYRLHWQPWKKGPNSRVNQKQLIHNLLAVTNGETRLEIMDCCIHLIRTLPILPVDKNNTEDVDTHAEDHLYDALRGGAAKNVPTKDEIRRRHIMRQMAQMEYGDAADTFGGSW